MHTGDSLLTGSLHDTFYLFYFLRADLNKTIFIPHRYRKILHVYCMIPYGMTVLDGSKVKVDPPPPPCHSIRTVVSCLTSPSSLGTGYRAIHQLIIVLSEDGVSNRTRLLYYTGVWRSLLKLYIYHCDLPHILGFASVYGRIPKYPLPDAIRFACGNNNICPFSQKWTGRGWIYCTVFIF